MERLKSLDVRNTDINEVELTKLPTTLEDVCYSIERRSNCKLTGSQLKEYKWQVIHPDFAKKGGCRFNKTYQQLWEEEGFTYEEAKQWIAVGQNPSNYWLAKILKENGFTYEEIKEWTEAGFFSRHHWHCAEVCSWKAHFFTAQQFQKWTNSGLYRNEAEFAYYLKTKGYQPSSVGNLKTLRKEFSNYIKDAQNYLNIYYPLIAKRKEIKELFITIRLENYLNLRDFVNLEKLHCPVNGFNKLTSLDVSNCEKLVELHCSGGRSSRKLSNLILPCWGRKLTKLNLSWNKLSDLSIFSHLKNLEELYLRANPLAGSLEPLKNLGKLKWLDIDDTDLDEGLECLPVNLKTICCSSENTFFGQKKYKVKKLADILKPYRHGYYELGGWGKGYHCDYQKWRIQYQEKKELSEAITEIERLIANRRWEIENPFLSQEEKEEIKKERVVLEKKLESKKKELVELGKKTILCQKIGRGIIKKQRKLKWLDDWEREQRYGENSFNWKEECASYYEKDRIKIYEKLSQLRQQWQEITESLKTKEQFWGSQNIDLDLSEFKLDHLNFADDQTELIFQIEIPPKSNQ